MKHLQQLGLSDDPFRNDHHEKFNVDSASQSDALRRLDRAVRQGRGLAVLIGAVGSGKTQVARRLYEDLEEEIFEAGMMVVLRDAVDADWLLARFASQLGVEEVARERDALIAALKSGKLYAAGLDVHNNEPAINPKYRGLTNTFLLPHIGSATRETRDAMGFRALDNLDAIFAQGEPRDRVA